MNSPRRTEFEPRQHASSLSRMSPIAYMFLNRTANCQVMVPAFDISSNRSLGLARDRRVRYARPALTNRT